jgi:probable rRNA maturation factor
MSINFEFVSEYSGWDVEKLNKIAEKVSEAAKTKLRLPKCASVAVLLCDNAKIQRLNRDFRGSDKVTNILSWPNESLRVATSGQFPNLAVNPQLGDLAMAYEACFSESCVSQIAFSDHLAHLLLHGTLHLLGYDHMEDTDALIMEAIEIEVLAKMCISNPYIINEEI